MKRNKPVTLTADDELDIGLSKPLPENDTIAELSKAEEVASRLRVTKVVMRWNVGDSTTVTADIVAERRVKMPRSEVDRLFKLTHAAE